MRPSGRIVAPPYKGDKTQFYSGIIGYILFRTVGRFENLGGNDYSGKISNVF